MVWVNEISDSVLNYVSSLKKDGEYSYFPALNNLTYYGENLSLGFSTYALKIYFILNEWENLSQEQKNTWINYILSFQKNEKGFPSNSFIDKYLVENYHNLDLKRKSIDFTKKTLNLIRKSNFETNKFRLIKAVNAETKQAISTLNQVNFFDYKKLENVIQTNETVESFLEKFDWSFPWNAGAQFSSLCVYSVTNNLNIENQLLDFIKLKLDNDTGSYFSYRPNSNREIINGAMKVNTGLDWIGHDIHEPEKLIDFCINNKPISEGCDIVDYVYVLSSCSQQTNYKKNKVNSIFTDLLEEIKTLYNPVDGAFSYFKNKCQTHYYGANIINQSNQSDIHGTLLCLWGIAMIIKNLEEDKYNVDWKLIKP